uniref:Syntaxin 6 n=1 Tax=Cynoglossus semilaevis TaxID=244447 RepID=A0A3P8UK18_CYNSE
MSMEDPFFVVKGEVEKAVNAAQSLHHRWTELVQEGGGASKEEMDWTTNELRNSLRSIEWDLEDLDETSNPRKFNLDAPELSKRKAFISKTRETLKVQLMKEQMSSPAAALVDKKNKQVPTLRPGPDKFVRLDQQLQNANSQFIEEQQSQQQLIAEQQDEQLELVSGTIGVLKNMSERIGMELDEQAVMLDDFGHEMDNTQSRLDNVMKKLAKVSHMTSDRRQWCAIGVLLAILFVILLLFFIL